MTPPLERVVYRSDGLERVTLHEGPDELGRYQFTIEWWDERPLADDAFGQPGARWRGQVQRCVPPSWALDTQP